jgi:hypothetical protein
LAQVDSQLGTSQLLAKFLAGLGLLVGGTAYCALSLLHELGLLCLPLLARWASEPSGRRGVLVVVAGGAPQPPPPSRWIDRAEAALRGPTILDAPLRRLRGVMRTRVRTDVRGALASHAFSAVFIAAVVVQCFSPLVVYGERAPRAARARFLRSPRLRARAPPRAVASSHLALARVRAGARPRRRAPHLAPAVVHRRPTSRHAPAAASPSPTPHPLSLRPLAGPADVWTSVVLFPSASASTDASERASSAATSDSFVRTVYAFAFGGFNAFRLPQLVDIVSADDAAAAVFAMLRSQMRVEALTTGEWLAGSRALAAVAIIVGALKPISLLLCGLLSALDSCSLRATLDTVPLGVTARMGATVASSVFERETADLSRRAFSRVELAALCTNSLAANAVVRTLLLTDTPITDDGASLLADALRTMRALRAVAFGRQPWLRAGGVAELARALAAVPALERVELDGATLDVGALYAAGEAGGVVDLGLPAEAAVDDDDDDDEAEGAVEGESVAATAPLLPTPTRLPPLLPPLQQRRSRPALPVLPLSPPPPPPPPPPPAKAEPNGDEVSGPPSFGPLHCVLLVELLGSTEPAAAARGAARGVGRLRELRLRGCEQIGERGALVVAPALARIAPALRALDLSGCGLGESAATALAAALPALRPSLRFVSLSANPHFGDGGCATVLRAVCALRALETLRLRGVGLRAVAASGLTALPTSLTELDLAHNPALGPEGAAALCALLLGRDGALLRLRVLRLGGCALGDDGCAALCDALAAADGALSLRVLGLARNGVGTAAADALGRSLPRFGALRALALGD